MAGRKRVTALKALELLQSIQEDDSDAEIVIESDTDVYNLHEDNRDDSEGESSSDNESLVSESSKSKISDFEDNETNSKKDEDHFYQNNTSCATSDTIIWDLLNPDQQNSGRQSYHNVITEVLGHLLNHIVVLSKNRFEVYEIYLLMKVCCVICKDVPKKKLKEFYKQTIGACRYMN